MVEPDKGGQQSFDVIVVSPNTAVDSYYILPHLYVGNVNRAEHTIHTAGGKGNNLARAVKALGGKVLSIGISGGYSGQFVAKELQREGIPFDNVWVNQETRRSSTLIVPDQVQTTVALDSGIILKPDEGDLLVQKIFQWISSTQFLVITGSLPPGLPVSYYADLVSSLKDPASPCVCLDCYGDALYLAVKAGVEIVKVNIQEFVATFGNGRGWNWEMAYEIFHQLQRLGTRLLIVTAGSQGAYVFDKDLKPYRVATVVDKIISTAGAGDSFLAGLLVALSRGDTIVQATCFGSAAAAANLSQVVCGALAVSDVENYLKQTELFWLA